MDMPEIIVPPTVRTVLIFADKDRTETGAKAAEKLRSRLAREGKLAVIIHIQDAIPEGVKGLTGTTFFYPKALMLFQSNAQKVEG